jgi:hypothetical protein
LRIGVIWQKTWMSLGDMEDDRRLEQDGIAFLVSRDLAE